MENTITQNTIHCRMCGKVLNESSKFCTGCGHMLAMKQQTFKVKNKNRKLRAALITMTFIFVVVVGVVALHRFEPFFGIPDYVLQPSIPHEYAENRQTAEVLPPDTYETAFSDYIFFEQYEKSEYDWKEQTYVMIFNDELISTSDVLFMSHLTGQSFNEFTRYGLLYELMIFLTILQKGEAHGVGLTSEEIATNEVEAREIRVLMEDGHVGALDFISDRRIGELMGAIDQVGSRLFDIFIEYVPDEEEFRELFDELVAHEIYVSEHTDPLLELEAFEAYLRELFIQQRRMGLFHELVNEWVREAVYEVNYYVFNNLG